MMAFSLQTAGAAGLFLSMYAGESNGEQCHNPSLLRLKTEKHSPEQ